MKSRNNFFRTLYARYKLRKNTVDAEGAEYLNAYTARTDALVQIDPELAIGGMWEEMGRHQFDFLLSQGLSREDSFLDIGCGTLRAGRFFVEFLEPELYFGFDLSGEAIRAGRSLIDELGLADKKPDLRKSSAKDLRFKDYKGKTFDFLLAQSVFSHLQADQIRECFEHVGSIMSDRSAFFFTYHPGDTQRARSQINFEYPYSFFEELADDHAFNLIDLSDVYKHPRSQRMIKATRASKA